MCAVWIRPATMRSYHLPPKGDDLDDAGAAKVEGEGCGADGLAKCGRWSGRDFGPTAFLSSHPDLAPSRICTTLTAACPLRYWSSTH